MAKNEPLSFGKPLLILVLAGVGFGGYRMYKTWPTTVEQANFKVSFPPKWTISQKDGRTVVEGKIGENGYGYGWVLTTPHGTVSWPDMALATLSPNVATSHIEADVNIFKGLIAYYDDGDYKYMAAVLNDPGHFITVAIGSHKNEFEQHRALFDKCVRSIKVSN
jgi:hypothetical protein